MEPYPLWLRQLLAGMLARALSDDPKALGQLVESVETHQLQIALSALDEIEAHIKAHAEPVAAG